MSPITAPDLPSAPGAGARVRTALRTTGPVLVAVLMLFAVVVLGALALGDLAGVGVVLVTSP